MSLAIGAVLLCAALVLVIFGVLSLLGHQIGVVEPKHAPAPKPVDVAAVAADDAMIDRLARGCPPSDDNLEQMLAAFVAECDAPTEPALEAQP